MTRMRRTCWSILKAGMYVVVFYAILVLVYFPAALIDGSWNNPYVLGLAISIASVATASLIADRFLDGYGFGDP